MAKRKKKSPVLFEKDSPEMKKAKELVFAFAEAKAAAAEAKAEAKEAEETLMEYMRTLKVSELIADGLRAVKSEPIKPSVKLEKVKKAEKGGDADGS